MKKKPFYWFTLILMGFILAFTMIDLVYTEEASVTSPFNEQVKVINVPQHPIYEYVKVSKTVMYTSGYADNQPSQGTKFSTRGGFSWTEENGTSINTTHSFGSINSSGGTMIKVPNKTDHFRLKVTKGNEVTKTAVYVKSETGDNKKFLYYIYPSNIHSLEFTTVIVN